MGIEKRILTKVSVEEWAAAGGQSSLRLWLPSPSAPLGSATTLLLLLLLSLPAPGFLGSFFHSFFFTPVAISIATDVSLPLCPYFLSLTPSTPLFLPLFHPYTFLPSFKDLSSSLPPSRFSNSFPSHLNYIHFPPPLFSPPTSSTLITPFLFSSSFFPTPTSHSSLLFPIFPFSYSTHSSSHSSLPFSFSHPPFLPSLLPLLPHSLPPPVLLPALSPPSPLFQPLCNYIKTFRTSVAIYMFFSGLA